MLTFKNTPVPAGLYDRFVLVDGNEPTTSEISVSVSTENNNISYKIINNTTNTTSLDLIIPFEIITNHALYSDQSIWTVSLDVINNNTKTHENCSQYVVKSSDIISMFSNTINTKDETIGREKYNTHGVPFRIFVPSKNSTIEDLVIVQLNPIQQVEYDVYSSVTLMAGQNILSWKDLISSINISGPSSINANESFTLSVQTEESSISEVFVEPICGYVNKTRVLLQNGTGSLQVDTSGLNTGDIIDIKFGFKQLTGIARYTKQIS